MGYPTDPDPARGQHPADGGRPRQGDACCGPACGAVAGERNRFFTGKFMAARDFSAEQDYFRSRHQLHNRLLHGWGIACGLEVTPHDNPDCAGRYVIVAPGIAFDCCGREVILEKKTAVLVWEPPEDAAGPEPAPADAKPAPQRDEYILYIRYCEQEIEQVPALYAENGCDPRALQANRIREVGKLEVRRRADVDAGCWPQQAQVDDANHKTACRVCGDTPAQEGCLQPKCPCSQGVPLALISRAAGPTEDGEPLQIDLTGRHDLPTPADYLTHIIGYNWPHGGKIKLSDLRGPMDRRLKVYFDRTLLSSGQPQPDGDGEAADEGPDGTGINVHTFTVQFYRFDDVHFPVSYLHTDTAGAQPHLEDEGCTAVFVIDPEALRGAVTLGGGIIHITLKCDFILDCNGRPVDGDHLKGQTPTGNGIASGTFESWFHVVDDRRAGGGPPQYK
jgi:hypothetical protein